MSTGLYLSCLWPGLPEIWWRGRLRSLPLAIAFAAALNLFLICGWIYPNWFSGGLFWLGTLFATVVWLFYVIQGLRGLPELINPRTVSDQPDRFGEAHQAYLKGEWKLAEKLLNGVLAIEPRDPPALIMLCSVYRHQSRLDAAEILLEEIGRLEVADAWWIEIDAERRRLRRKIAEKSESNSESATADLTASQAAAA